MSTFTVRECIDNFPFDGASYEVERREELLLADPLAGPGPRSERAPIEVVHFGATFVAQGFAPPRGVYESLEMRIEWQNMDGRQPFYHRNCGVDELAYQVCGERTLITELGTLELAPGDFTRIPEGVAHDNYGRRDVHLLFYFPGPVTEQVVADRISTYKAVPFDGWQPGIINELLTEGPGGPGRDLMFAPTDEALLLQHAQHDTARLEVLRPGDKHRTRWLYRGPDVVLGHTAALSDDGLCYVRHRNAEEVQYQISGKRTLVTQRGSVHLGPGDFVQVPRGVAFTSIHAEPSEHIVIASRKPIPQVAKAARQSARLSATDLASLRRR